MELIRPDINLNFVGRRSLAMGFSILIILIGLTSLVVKGGPNYGIDFAGGTLVQVQFKGNTNATAIKQALSDPLLGTIVVQSFGDEANEFLIRTENVAGGLGRLSEVITASLAQGYGADEFDVRRVEMVGPQVGKDLREKGLLALVYAMVGILAYVSWRFEFRFAVGAIVALLHDVIITLGLFSLFDKEIDLPIIAAFLAIIGYSLNDTIIVYDRIRENMARHGRDGFLKVVNRSINETLSRTILTSGTTLLVVAALFALGGGVIHNFAFALLCGILVGTYSSIFVASPILILWDERKKKKVAQDAA